MTRSGPRTARSRRTREALVAAVRDQVRAQGVFSIKEVCRIASCAPATYHAHFASKDEALTEAFAASLEELDQLAADLFGPDQPERPAATDLERRLVEFFRREARVLRAGLARAEEHRDLRVTYRRYEETAMARIVGFFTAAGSDAPRERASAMLVVLEGLNNPWLLALPPDDATHDRLADVLTALLPD